jgi:hypothetical protein
METSKCPKCGETEHITRLANDEGKDGEFNQCDTCEYIYEQGWQSYPWLNNGAK